ncbi:MAG TPA: hypothetical protein VKA70_03185 [Blastocatellia bacterium]|nr:hypothetical protein [Blastocatellia bacterium]
MRTSIIGVVLSISLLAATTRASQYTDPRRGDEPPAKAATVENVNKNQDQGSAQQTSPASGPTQAQLDDEKRIREVKNRVRRMGLARRITVVLLNGNERYGSIELIGEDSFQLAEVDTKQEIKVDYKDVKKVRTGYGNFHPLTGGRTNPKADLLVKIGVFAFVIIITAVGAPR